MGILLSFGALVSWGFGDFLIQRSIRRFSKWITLFMVTAFGSIATLPFVYKNLGGLLGDRTGLLILSIASIILLYAAIFDFKALENGKLSVVEPIFASEVLVTTGLAAFIAREFPSAGQLFFIFVSFFGILLVSSKSLRHLAKIRLERGAILAMLASLGMGAANFLFGFGSRLTNPLLVNWFTDTFLAIVMGIYLWRTGELRNIPGVLSRHKSLALGVSVLDKSAWLFFSFSMIYIPIAVATSISESYIALAVLLGLWLNHEKLAWHQYIGIFLAALSALALSIIS